MSLEDIQKTKEILEAEYNDNIEKMKEIKEKFDILEKNSFENRILFVITLSIIPLIIFCYTVSSWIQFIPLFLIQPIMIGAPIFIGILGEKLLTKKRKLKEKLSKFSYAKKEKELIEEKTRCKIEKEKIESLNNLIEKTYETLNIKEQSIHSISNDYKFEKKEVKSEEITFNIENLNETYLKNQTQIQLLTTKNVLKNTFYKTREKIKWFQLLCDITVFGWLGGVFFFMLYYFPSANIEVLKNIVSQLNSLTYFSPLIISGLLGTSYVLKRNKDYKIAFQNINNELGENAISLITNEEEEEKWENELENLIQNSSDKRLELETEKRKYENLTGYSYDILDKEWPRVKVTEQTRQHVKDHPEMYRNGPVRVQMGNYTDEEIEIYKDESPSGPLLVEESSTRKRGLFKPKEK